MNSNLKKLKIDFCSYEAAKFACKNWHYSKCMPVGKTFKVGAWEDDKFIGCVIFSLGASPHIGFPYKLPMTQICELTRVALTKHEAPVTKIVAVAIKLLKKYNKGLRLIVSFADVDQNHLGKIYQAGNWIYVGLTNVGFRSAWIIYGKKVHNKNISDKHKVAKDRSVNILGWVRKYSDPNATEFFSKGKYKYLYPLDDEMRVKIAKLAVPYPKTLNDTNKAQNSL